MTSIKPRMKTYGAMGDLEIKPLFPSSKPPERNRVRQKNDAQDQKPNNFWRQVPPLLNGMLPTTVVSGAKSYGSDPEISLLTSFEASF